MDATDSGLFVFRKYGFFVVDLYNKHRTHASLNGQTPIETPKSKGVDFEDYQWIRHRCGLYQTPIAA